MNKLMQSLNFAIIAVAIAVVVTGSVTYDYKLEISNNKLESDRMKYIAVMTETGTNPFEASCALKQHTTKICEQFLRQQED